MLSSIYEGETVELKQVTLLTDADTGELCNWGAIVISIPYFSNVPGDKQAKALDVMVAQLILLLKKNGYTVKVETPKDRQAMELAILKALSQRKDSSQE